MNRANVVTCMGLSFTQQVFAVTLNDGLQSPSASIDLYSVLYMQCYTINPFSVSLLWS